MKTIYSLVCVVVLMACKGNSEAPLKVAPSHQKTEIKDSKSKDLNATSTKSDVVFESETFNEVYDTYLDLKATLVNTNEEESAAATRAFFMLLKGDTTYASIHQAAIPFTEATTVKERRAIFEKVSRAMEAQIAKEKIVSGTIYKQYCPMAFNGKGAYWLSDSKEVRNPYYGDQMLKCGVVDSELGR